ncbi:unnamed protein product [Heterobilharzia americana]|nr:unnamed protein product [Heterobilharzia americana]CAH8436189.1 unnamed protein product [Heterobilharzia americana]
MFTYLTSLYQALDPLQSAYLLSCLVHNAFGLFECCVISKTKYATRNTTLYYLTCAVIAITRAIYEYYSPTLPTCFIFLFVFLFLSNCFYLFVCIIYAQDKHNTWVCITLLTFICSVYYCMDKDILLISNKIEALHTLWFLSSIVNNFILFDSLLSLMITRHHDCPPQWISLTAGMLQSAFSGLLNYKMNDTLLAPADSLGIAVHLFGIIVEIQCQLMHH